MKIDAENLLLGRFAARAAKSALLGEDVQIINCDKAVVSGRRLYVFQQYLRRKRMGTHRKGPFYFTAPDRFVKRTIRGMLPHRQEKGRLALKRIMCYSGVPVSMKKEDFHAVKSAHVAKLNSTKFVSVRQICSAMGGK
ncbi:MAG: 50S ribosomal protein L13 [Candidatus Woesearchaeota archaeon]